MRPAKEDAALVLNDRRSDRIQRLADELSSTEGQILVCAGDLRDPETARRTGTLIEERFGQLDILANCAGIAIPERRWAELQPEGIDGILSTNLAAPFYCVTVALPFTRMQKSGLLIHISSADGLRVGTVGGPAYM